MVRWRRRRGWRRMKRRMRLSIWAELEEEVDRKL
jgi:hypothetical protein